MKSSPIFLTQEFFIGKPNKVTQAKRNRERARDDHHKAKEEKKAQRGEQRKERERLISEGVDPDLLGIFAGPQAPSEE